MEIGRTGERENGRTGEREEHVGTRVLGKQGNKRTERATLNC
jgi:hypothetical protein